MRQKKIRPCILPTCKSWVVARQMADYSVITLAHKALHFNEPENLSRALSVNRTVRERSTRQDSLLYVPRSKTETGKRRFCCRAPSLLNQVPSEVRELSVKGFPRVLKRHLRGPSAGGARRGGGGVT